MNKKYPLKIGVTGDNHLNHPKTPPIHILKSFSKHIVFNDVLMAGLSLLVINGDLFDGPLGFFDDCAPDINHFFLTLFHQCYKHNVVLRVVEGTRSHELAQSRVLDKMHEALSLYFQNFVNFKYIDEISVEHIDALGIDCLYIPDDVTPTLDEAVTQANAALQAAQLSQVDFCFIHGCIDFQVPKGAQIESFETAWLESITKYYTFANHIHQYGVNGRVIGVGSLERLIHDDENPKGFVVATIENDRHWAQFIENPDAAIYKSIYVNQEDLSFALQAIRQAVEGFADGANVRLVLGPDAPKELLRCEDALKKIHPKINWRFKVEKPANQPQQTLIKKQINKGVVLNAATLPDLLDAAVMQHRQLSDKPRVLDRCRAIIKSITA